MKKLSQIVVILLFGLNLSGQSVWIDSLYSNPQSPTIEDTVRIVGEIRTASAGCYLISTELEIDEINKTIEITGCYAIGPIDTICPSIDTFLIGKLQEGEYQIIFTVNGFETILNPNGDCSNSINETEKEIQLLVSGTNSAENKKEQQLQFGLIENPVKDYAVFWIKPSVTETEIVITDNLGRMITKNKIARNNGEEIKVEVGRLPSGIYYCYLVNEGSISKPIKMIKE
jgi:hypothetical protein